MADISLNSVPATRRSVLVAGGVAAAAALTACDSTKTAKRPKVAALPGVKKRGGNTISFKYMRPTWGPATYTKGGPYEKELFGLGNVVIDAQIVSVVDYDTKANTILASGHIPDVMWGSGPMSPTWKDAQDQGAFLPIDKYLDKYPALKAAVPSHTWDELRDKSGDIYFIPNTLWPVVPFFAFYRQDLFQDAGVNEKPASQAEFIDMLEHLHAAHPKQYPLSLALDAYLWQGKDLATTFGVSLNGWMPKQGDPSTLIPWFEQPQQENFFFWLQEIHKRGLLDPNSGIHDDPTYMQDEFKAGKSAILLENWAVYPSLVGDLKKAVPHAKVRVLPPIGPAAGTRVVFPVDRGIYVSSDFKGADDFFDFLNWTLTDGSSFRRWGIKGKTYRVVKGKKQGIPDDERPKGYEGPQIEPLSFISPFSEKLDWDNTRQSYAASGLEADFGWMKAMFDRYQRKMYPDWADPTVISPTDQKKGTQLLENTLNDTVNAVVINNKLTRKDWQKAVGRWEAGGGTKIIRERNQLQKDKSKPNYLK